LLLAFIALAGAMGETLNQVEVFAPDRVSAIEILDRRSASGIVIQNNLRASIVLTQTNRGDIEIALRGDVDTNRRRCMPELQFTQRGGILTASLETCSRPTLFMSMRGRLAVEVSVPRGWQGDYSVDASSAEVVTNDARLGDIDLEVSSGSLAVGNVEGRDARFAMSSGSLRGASIRANSVVVDTSSGNVDIDAIDARTVSIDSSSGGVSVDEIAGDVEVDISSGGLRLDFRGQPGSLVAETSSGGMRVAGMDGPVEIDSTSGGVHIDFARFAADSKIESSSGNVRISLPADSGLDIDLDTSSGRIRVDFPVTVQGSLDDDEVQGRIGDGGPTLEVDAGSGDITIEAR
jgi:hypothetical protein